MSEEADGVVMLGIVGSGEGVTLADWIELQIHGVFVRAAQMMGYEDLMQEEAEGVPLALFQADVAMRAAWRSYVREVR